MDAIQLLGTAAGLGFLAGMRLYATILGLGLAVRFHWLTLPAGLEHLRVLADERVLLAAGIACAIEFVSDKVPWVDSLWDGFHTFIRPVGAVVLGATAFSSLDPALKMMLAILCGAVAFTSHTSKAATRLMVNHSPEPLSNLAMSAAGDLFVPFGLWVVMSHPVVALAFVGVFVAAFLWLAPKVFRLMRESIQAVVRWVRGEPVRGTGLRRSTQ